LGAGRMSTVEGSLRSFRASVNMPISPSLTIPEVVSRMAVVAAPLVLTLTLSPALRPLSLASSMLSITLC